MRPLCTTDRVAELESVVTSLEGQPEEQPRDADNAIAQWQESHSALEARSLDIPEGPAELESTVKTLKGQLEDQSRGADFTILQLQESYSALEARYLELEGQLFAIAKEKEELLSANQPGAAERTDELETLRSEKARLESELQERGDELANVKDDLNQDADVVHEWEGAFT